MENKKPKAVVVLSGDNFETIARVKKGLELSKEYDSLLLLNGFNTEEEHDEDFRGN